MVINKKSKTNIFSIFMIASLGFGAILPAVLPLAIGRESSAACAGVCSDDAVFNLQVNEVLEVAIATPDAWASGPINTLLTNKVNVSVASNNPAGFAATMKSASETPDLVNQYNSSYYIPTLSEETTATNFGANQWGYNITDSGSTAPTSYLGMAGSEDMPILIASLDSIGTATKDVYFAAKADNETPSGTYVNSVIISVVSGVITSEDDDPNNNPITPVNPITPSDDIANDNTSTETSHGNSPSGTSVVAVTTTDDGTTTTTTTESYAKPHGVTEKIAAINITDGNTTLATILAAMAGASATTCTLLFILAKRKSREEDEDDSAKNH